MGMYLKVWINDKKGKEVILSEFKMSSIFMDYYQIKRDLLTRFMKVFLDVPDFGVSKNVSNSDFKEALSELLEVVDASGEIVNYSFREADAPKYDKGGRGQTCMIKGVPGSLEGGMDYCMLQLGPHGEYPNISYDQEVDLRNKEYIDTDRGRILILKSQPKKMPEFQDFKELEKILKNIPVDYKIHLIIE